jgi:hypothetical protein
MRGYNNQSDTGEAKIYEYFRFIKNKDIDKLLSLFTDAIIYEPFSKAGDTDGLQGRTAIESFLNIAIMANSGSIHQIEIIKSDRKVCNNNNNQITANVTFERGGKVKAKFIFEFSSDSLNFHKQEKIQSLRIEFIK